MTIKERVYKEIYSDIFAGKYGPNEILTENKLVEKYAVSKSPVREALLELCKDQVLQSLPRLGYQVKPVSLKEVLDILEYRIDMEISGLRRAFPYITEQDIQILDEMSDKTPEELIDPDWSRNESFHLKLYELSSNHYGYQELQKTLKQSSRFITQYFHTAWQKANEMNNQCHKEIVNCIRDGNLEGACRKLSHDIASIKEEIQKMHRF